MRLSEPSSSTGLRPTRWPVTWSGSNGCRKVRWGAGGKGTRGGVRVIYTTRLANGVIVALTIYGKGAVENIPAHILRQLA